jgi:hypothetical protein
MIEVYSGLFHEKTEGQEGPTRARLAGGSDRKSQKLETEREPNRMFTRSTCVVKNVLITRSLIPPFHLLIQSLLLKRECVCACVCACVCVENLR